MESERIKKQYNFKFVAEYQIPQNDFSNGMIAEESAKYNPKDKIE